MNIIERFFQKIENSLIYVCSDENEKAQQRFEIFNRWYEKSVAKDKIVKIDNEIIIHISDTLEQKLYTSFLFHKQNSNYQKLIEIYNQFEAILNEQK